jgi:hypothetical protein
MLRRFGRIFSLCSPPIALELFPCGCPQKGCHGQLQGTIPVTEEERMLGAKQERGREGTASGGKHRSLVAGETTGGGEHRSLVFCPKYPEDAVLATARCPPSDIDSPSVTGIGHKGLSLRGDAVRCLPIIDRNPVAAVVSQPLKKN